MAYSGRGHPAMTPLKSMSFLEFCRTSTIRPISTASSRYTHGATRQNLPYSDCSMMCTALPMENVNWWSFYLISRHHRHWYTSLASGAHFRNHRITTPLAENIPRRSIAILSNRKRRVRGGVLPVRRSAGFSPQTGAFVPTYVAPIAGEISFSWCLITLKTPTTPNYTSNFTTDALETLDSCFQSVHRWFTENGLALNPDKSEAIVTSKGARIRQEGRIDVMTLGSALITVSGLTQSRAWASPLMRLSLFQHPRQQRRQGNLLPHQGTANASTRRLHERWPAHLLVPVSTTAIQYCMVPPSRTSIIVSII